MAQLYPKYQAVVLVPFDQTVASDTWSVNHNAGTCNIMVQVFDETNSVIIPDSIVLTDENIVTITFSSPQAGRVMVLVQQQI